MRSSLCFTVLSCLIGVVFGQYVPVCDPANYTEPPLVPVPVLPAQFSFVVEANLLQRTSNIKEYVDEVGNRGRLELSSTNFGANTIVGIFNYSNREIFLIPDVNTSDACAVKPIANLSAPSQAPSVGFQDVNGAIQIGTVSRFFQLLRNTTNATWLGVEVVRGIPCNCWQTCTAMQSSSYTLDYYFATENWDFALGDGPTPVQVVLTVADSRGSLRHTYSFVSFKTGPRSVPDEVFTVPIGLICTGRTPGPPTPPFPDYFSMSLEVVLSTRRSVVVYKVSYCTHFVNYVAWTAKKKSSQMNQIDS